MIYIMSKGHEIFSNFDWINGVRSDTKIFSLLLASGTMVMGCHRFKLSFSNDLKRTVSLGLWNNFDF